MNMEYPEMRTQFARVNTQSLRGAEKQTNRKYKLCNKNEVRQLLKYAPMTTTEEIELKAPILVEVKGLNTKIPNIVFKASNLPDKRIKLEIYNQQNPEMPNSIAFFHPGKPTFDQVITLIEFAGSTDKAHREADRNSKECARNCRLILQAILNSEKNECAFQKRSKGKFYLKEEFLKKASYLVVVPSYKKICNGKEIMVKGYKYYKPESKKTN